MRVVGLMSGTSADAVDAALVEWPDGPGTRPFRLLAYREDPFPAALRERVHALAAARVPAERTLLELAALDVELGERFAAAAGAVAAEAGLDLGAVDAIASHGQTVAHHPEVRASLQIGDPSVIAERTGRTTVADFRARDLAAGGEGAPLAPFFHWAALGRRDEGRLVVNLGGMANVTWLPAGGRGEDVVAFDVGPANALLDGVVTAATAGRERMDRGGARAAQGRVDPSLLARLLDDAFLRRPPPKSTGRERYGTAEATELVAGWGDRPLEDLLATLTRFTAEAVAGAWREHLAAPGGLPDRVLLAGGGVRNATLGRLLGEVFAGAPVAPTDEAGVPADAVEAMAFSLMGRNALLGLPNHLPACTGARAARVLGEIVRP